MAISTRVGAKRSTLARVLAYINAHLQGDTGATLEDIETELQDLKDGSESTITDLEGLMSDSASWSTSEVATAGQFLGSTIYRKAVAMAAGPNNEELSIAHGITGLARVVNMRVVMNATTSHRQIPFVGDPAEAKATNDPTAIQMRVSGNNVLVKSVGNYASSAGHILLEYTKS